MGGGHPIDLFAGVGVDGAWTVTQVNQRARQVLEMGLEAVWVRGEVTNFKAYQSGHWYFTLRDEQSQLRCIMWASDNRRLPTPPADGMQIFVHGRPTVWEERGEYRLTVKTLLATDRDGLWRLAFEKARAGLEKDGLLDPQRKRALPPFPRTIAVVTSPDGAAVRDIIAVVRRRWPVATLIVIPTRVQGEGAEDDLCRALARVNRVPSVDVAIVGRGGGSREDLWTFNAERVARALAKVRVPTVSAVGHEVDVTLCDLVADHRAATPSAAAEHATPDVTEVVEMLASLGLALGRGLGRRAERGQERVHRTADRLGGAIGAILEGRANALALAGAQLDALSPLKVLDRGYAVARDLEGRVLSRVEQFAAGMAFRVRVKNGEVPAEVQRGREGKR